MPAVINIHCPNCNQVIVEQQFMRPLSNWQNTPRAGDLMVIHKGPLVILNADFLCPTCGRGVFFRLNEQKLNLLIMRNSHE